MYTATRQIEEEKTPSQWPDDDEEELNTEGVELVDDSMAGWDELTTTGRAAGPITPSPNSRRASSSSSSSNGHHYDVHRAMQNKITTRSSSSSATCSCRYGFVTLLLAILFARIL